MASGTQRLFYLDALRAFAMLFGILVHGTTIANPKIYPLFALASEFFRMATFFLISGFFAALVWERRGSPAYWWSRRDVIVYPLATCLVLLAPITNWLIFRFHNGPISMEAYFLDGGWRLPSVGNDVWHLHFWFLFTLAIFAMLAPLLVRMARTAMFRRLLERYLAMTSGWTIWANVLIVAMMVVVARGVWDLALGHLFGATPFSYILRSALTFLPWFLLGLVGYLHRDFFRTLHRADWLGLALMVGLHVLVRGQGDLLPRTLERIAYWLTHSGVMVLLISTMMALFQRWLDKPSAALTFLVDAAYSFYLLHITVIFTIATIAYPLTGNIYTTFWIVVFVGLPLTLAIHRFVIQPSPLLRLMFNGKRPAAPKPVPRVAE